MTTTDTLIKALEKQEDIPGYLWNDVKAVSDNFSEFSDADLSKMRERIWKYMGSKSAQVFDKYVKDNK